MAMAGHEVYESIRILLKEPDVPPRPVVFGHCFLPERAQATITLTTETLEDNEHRHIGTQITITIQPSGVQADCAVLGHSKSCPARLIHDEVVRNELKLPALVPRSDKQTRVGVCVVINHLGHLLLTRRSNRLRTFPHKWVFPGGHVNYGETLEEAAARETLEETGLVVSNLQLYCCWESCYPTYLTEGTIAAHHLVVYFRGELLSNDFRNRFPTSDELKISQDECDAFTWIDQSTARNVLNREKLDSPFLVLEVQDGCIVPCNRPIRHLSGTANAAVPKESLALGTSFVLEQWLAHEPL